MRRALAGRVAAPPRSPVRKWGVPPRASSRGRGRRAPDPRVSTTIASVIVRPGFTRGRRALRIGRAGVSVAVRPARCRRSRASIHRAPEEDAMRRHDDLAIRGPWKLGNPPARPREAQHALGSGLDAIDEPEGCARIVLADELHGLLELRERVAREAVLQARRFDRPWIRRRSARRAAGPS